MNKSTVTKLLAAAMCCLMLLGMLAGCGSKDSQETQPTSAAGETVAAPDYFGMLVINANGTVNVTYNEKGQVTNIEGIDEQGLEIAVDYQDFLEVPCSDAVCTLVKNAIGKGFLNTQTNDIIIRQAYGSQNAADGFLDKIVTDVQAVVDNAKLKASIVLISAEDLDHNGYISLKKAQELVFCYLNVTEVDLFEGTDVPVNGTYSFEVAVGYLEDHYLVDAATGVVYEGYLEGYDFADEGLGMDEIPEEYYDATLATEAATTEAATTEATDASGESTAATQAAEETTAASQDTTAATQTSEAP